MNDGSKIDSFSMVKNTLEPVASDPSRLEASDA